MEHLVNLGTLRNIATNNNKISIETSCSNVGVPYFDDNTSPVYPGPRGWIGPGQSYPPEKAYFSTLYIDIPKIIIDSVTNMLNKMGLTNAKDFTHHYKDNGFIFSFNDKIDRYDLVDYERQIIKHPWFDDLLDFMRVRVPSYTEDELMDIQIYDWESTFFNKCALKDVVEAHSDDVAVYDDNISVLKISIMYDEIPPNIEKINNIIDTIYSLME